MVASMLRLPQLRYLTHIYLNNKVTQGNNNMKWLDDFYISDNITYDRRVLKRKVFRRKHVLFYHILTLSNIRDGMVDIIPASEVKLLHKMKRDNFLVVGIAKGQNEAQNVVAQMLEDAFEENGNYNLKEFFLNKEKGE